MAAAQHSQALESLLDKIRFLVARYDINGFGMCQLAQHAGISPSMIYYFSNYELFTKQDIGYLPPKSTLHLI